MPLLGAGCEVDAMTALLRLLHRQPCTCGCIMCRMENHRDCRFTHDRRCRGIEETVS